MCQNKLKKYKVKDMYRNSWTTCPSYNVDTCGSVLTPEAVLNNSFLSYLPLSLPAAVHTVYVSVCGAGLEDSSRGDETLTRGLLNQVSNTCQIIL